MIKELIVYRKNIFYPKFSCEYRVQEITNFEYVITRNLKLGTYIKPLSKLIAWVLKKGGYRVNLRGRGKRVGKYYNNTRDIRMKDSLFCGIYAQKKIKV